MYYPNNVNYLTFSCKFVKSDSMPIIAHVPNLVPHLAHASFIHMPYILNPYYVYDNIAMPSMPWNIHVMSHLMIVFRINVP